MAVKYICSFAISLILVLILMPHLIDYLKKIAFNQSVSEYSLEEYKKKAKTPAMGGILFIIVPVVMEFILFPEVIHDMDMAVVMLAFVGYGAIGFLDDYLIAVKKNNDGLKAWQKFALQMILAAVFYLAYRQRARLDIPIPFTNYIWHIGRYYALLILLMFTGSSNAVNLTDGMDGLAAGCMVCSLVPFILIAQSTQRFALCGFLLAVEGALFGYLYYNVAPAKIFMGDTGSLALGALLAATAMILKKELALIVIGGVFVIETLCVILQISSVKLRGKKIFPYTPIHYSFVLKGISEKKTVRLFWLAAVCFAFLGYWVALH